MAISVVVPGGTGSASVTVDLNPEGVDVWPYFIDVLEQFGPTKTGMVAALAQAKAVGGAPCTIWLKPNGLTGYDWEDGNFGTIDTDNLTIRAEFGATVLNITENTPGPLFKMTGEKQSLLGLTVVYDAGLTAFVGPTLVDDGTTDLIVRDFHTVNGPSVARLGETLRSARAFYENIVGELWRPSISDQQDWFLVNYTKSLHVRYPKMTSNDDGYGQAFVAVRANHFTDTVDTAVFEFTAGGAAPNAQPYGLVLDSTGGPIVNWWFNKGVFDRATVASVLIKSDAGGKSIQNVNFDGIHLAPYGAPCIKIDWQTDDNLGNLVFADMLMIFGTFAQSTAIPIIIDAPNALGLFKGPQFNGGTIVNVSHNGDAGTMSDCVIQSNASFWMHGTNYELRDTSDDLTKNRLPTYFLKETGDFSYLITNCNIEGISTQSNYHFPGRTKPYTVTNNFGLLEDTAKIYAAATSNVAARGATTLQSTTFLTQLVTSGATLTDARLAIYDTFIASLITAGIWDKTGLLYLPAAADEISALTSLYTPGANPLQKFGTLTHVADRGYTPDGSTGYLSQVRSLADCGATLNNAGVFVWCGTELAADNSFIIGTDTDVLMRQNPRRSSSAKLNSRLNDALDTATTNSTTSVGGYAMFRTGSTNYIEVQNNVETTVTKASSALSTGSVTLNRDGASPKNYDTRKVAGVWAGQYLDGTARTALFNAFHTYMAAIGAPV
jgi:hypothetical protein